MHGHDHHHHAHHRHAHTAAANGRHDLAFAAGIGLNGVFVALEFAFGIVADSTALVADAIHNLSDVAALALAWFAAWLARRAPGPRFTYGLRSSTILAALANAVMLLLACGGLALEALHKLFTPGSVAGATVMVVALVGVAVNGVTAMFFLRDRAHDLNLRAAFMHMLADALISLGVAVSGYLMLRGGWYWLDPLVSFAIMSVVLVGTWRLLQDSALLSLHAVPAHLDSAPVTRFLQTQQGVSGVHDLHIWALSTTEVALTAHLVMPLGHPGDDFLDQLAQALRDEFAIHHATFQVETGVQGHACTLLGGAGHG
ncbi:MAG: cation transporter [Proteobacteria bacterium]|nr:cation transporter [Pseudomonadota bacterium]